MIKYYKNLINRIYNILWVYDNNYKDYDKCLNNIMLELSGNNDYEEIIRVGYKIKGLIATADVSQLTVRSTIFGCIDLVNIIIKKIEGDIFE